MTTDAARDRKLIAALTAAQLYYMQDQTMEVIARELGTSRSSVSRLLSFAREVGLDRVGDGARIDSRGLVDPSQDVARLQAGLVCR